MASISKLVRFVSGVVLLAFLAGPATAQQVGIITTVAGGGNQNDTAASLAFIPSPSAVTADAQGNLYIACYDLHQVFRVDSSGRLHLLAGTGTRGSSGDGGPAASAELIGPFAMAVDAIGNVFIGDWSEAAAGGLVRRVDASTGIITTVVGNGTLGFSGDGGPAKSAELTSPSGLALGSYGNLFIADSTNNRIRRVDASTQIITTVAGNGTAGFGGDGGPAIQAQLIASGVALDASGNLFIAGDNRIRRVDASSGIITTVAGNGSIGFSGDGGPATNASIWGPYSVAVDAAGNLFIADFGNWRIRRVDATTQIITTVAGMGLSTLGSLGDGGPATSAELSYPSGVWVDASGSLLIADSGNDRVRRVQGTTGIISTVAGGGPGGDGGDAANAQLVGPSGLSTDPSGTLFIADNSINVADSSSNRIRRVDAASQIITTVAGGGYDHDDVPATSSRLYFPSAVAVDSSRNLFIADSEYDDIRRVDAATQVITTVAGNGTSGFAGDGGPAADAQLAFPEGIAVDGSGSLFIADTNNDRVRRVDATTQIITTVAGNGTGGFSGDGGPATTAELSDVGGVAVDGSGNLFIADTANLRIRRVDAATQIITTVAGNGTAGFSGDGGPATAAGLGPPSAVAIDTLGNLFIPDGFANRVRMVDAKTQIINTIAGDGSYGSSGDGGEATSAQLATPSGVAVDAHNHLFMSETGSNRIRALTVGPAVSLSSESLVFANQIVTSTSAAQSVTLTNSGNATLTISSIAASGDFAETNNCDGAVNASATCTINVTFTPTASGSCTGAVTITDNVPGSPPTIALLGTGADFSLSISPTSATITAGQTATYTLSVTGLGGFNQVVALACTGAPSLSTCTVSPSPVTPNGSSAATASVTVTTTAATMVTPRYLVPPLRWWSLHDSLPLALWLLVLSVILGIATKRRRRWSFCALAITVMTVAVWAGCGGGVTSSPGTPVGAYTLRVTATFTSGSVNLSHTQTLVLTVN